MQGHIVSANIGANVFQQELGTFYELLQHPGHRQARRRHAGRLQYDEVPGLGGTAPDGQKGAVDPQRSDPVCRKVAPRQAVSSLLLNAFYCTKLLLSDVKTG